MASSARQENLLNRQPTIRIRHIRRARRRLTIWFGRSGIPGLCLTTLQTAQTITGRYQFPEKMIPLMINNALNDKELPVYGDGLHVRDWLYVYDHCTAVWMVLTKAKPGETYNIGGCNEKRNIEVVELILERLKKPKSLIRHVTDRPGHDRRYAIDASKIIKELGWKPTVSFEEGLSKTIDWYLANQNWLKNVVSGDYRKYYKQMYSNR